MANRPKAKKKTAAKKKSKSAWFVYVLECANGRLYTGITTDLENRFATHCAGKGAMFTRLNRPKQMIGATPCKNRSAASKLEWKIKSLKVEQKKALAATWAVKQLPKLN
jgi:putative endonuclease